jgi:hypothetical protein
MSQRRRLVMDRHMKSNWWLLAVIGCAALAADPSLAARRGKSAPHASPGVSQDGQGLSHGAASPASRAPEPAVTDTKTGIDTAHQNSGPPEPSATISRVPNANGKFPGTAHGIDLVRPDDGYAGLRRRAARSSLISAAQGRKPQIVAPALVTPHPPSPAGATAEPVRNSAGMPMPAHTGGPKADAASAVMHQPANAGPARNSLGLAMNETHRHDIRVTATTATPPVTGINGTTMGHAGIHGIGGPAKERSAIGGSAFRKF